MSHARSTEAGLTRERIEEYRREQFIPPMPTDPPWVAEENAVLTALCDIAIKSLGGPSGEALLAGASAEGPSTPQPVEARPDSGSVGPWKERVYKHPDTQKVLTNREEGYLDRLHDRCTSCGQGSATAIAARISSMNGSKNCRLSSGL